MLRYFACVALLSTYALHFLSPVQNFERTGQCREWTSIGRDDLSCAVQLVHYQFHAAGDIAVAAVCLLPSLCTVLQCWFPFTVLYIELHSDSSSIFSYLFPRSFFPFSFVLLGSRQIDHPAQARHGTLRGMVINHS